MTPRIFWLALPALLWTAPALACLWDNDTLREESLSQQEVARIVSGQIEKHSTYFYEQKVTYTEPLVSAGDAPPERYDDLAVAYEKLGRYEDAIRIMQDKEAKHPGLYTTAANLGTFYAHAGDYAEALTHLERALTINPSAHFGREEYQVKALKFLLARKDDPSLDARQDLLGIDLDKQAMDVWLGSRASSLGVKDDTALALAGIIRFGSGDQSPHLWFSLGLTLEATGARQLALRAYRRAEVLGHPAATTFAEKTVTAMREHRGKRWADLTAALDKEFEAGQSKIAKLQAKEDARLQKGKYKQVFGY